MIIRSTAVNGVMLTSDEIAFNKIIHSVAGEAIVDFGLYRPLNHNRHKCRIMYASIN